MKKIAATFFLVMVLSACVKDKPDNSSQPQVQLTSAKKVYIVNEGPFRKDESGSISLFDTGSKDVIGDFYETQNNAQLGSIAQSMNDINGSYYIVVNNANKIVICDHQFKRKAQINGLNSPRYIQPITNQKAYVTDLYANAISIVDLNTNTKTGSINCFGKTEKMVLIYNKVFVTNSDKAYVYIINTMTDVITDSVFVGMGASSIVTDKNDRVWVLGSGDGSAGGGRLTRINPLTNQSEQFFSFQASDLPGNLCQNRTKDTLYFLNNGIYRMSVAEQQLPAMPFINKGAKNFYGLGVNPNDYTVYAADALDYSQRSQIYIYKADGSQAHTFKAGVISNSFYFE